MTRLLLLVLIAAPMAAWAAALDAPVVSAPTVRTEITRGFEAARACPIRLSAYGYEECIQKLERADASTQPNTLPFRTGLRLAAWQSADIRYQVDLEEPNDATRTRQLESDEAYANGYFADFKGKARELGLSDNDAIPAIGISPAEVGSRYKFYNDRYIARRLAAGEQP